MANTITLLDSGAVVQCDGTAYPLTVVYHKLLDNYLSKRIALKNATIDNYDAFITSGSAIYTIANRVGTQDYKSIFDDSGPNKINKASANNIQVDLNYSKEVNFGVLPTDLARFGAKFDYPALTVGEGLLSRWQTSRANAVEAYLSAKLTQLAVRASIQNGIIQLILPKDDGNNTPSPDDYRQNIILPILDVLAGMKTLITNDTIGYDEEDFTLWINPFFGNRLLLSTQLVGSDKSFETLQKAVINQVAGINIVEDPFLGKFIPKSVPNGGPDPVCYGQGIDKDEEFDFTSCHAVLMHKNGVAFPFQRVKTKEYDLFSDGSLKFLTILNVNKDGGAILRPQVIKGFVFVTPITNIIRTTNLGDIVMAGTTPTVDELETAISAKNPLYIKGMATFSSIDVGSAVATGVNSKFTIGTVTLTYTKAQ